uniref:Putative product n=1 Tax=Xenopsylla cheopis TaxID=163159 RepID=A0A6M2DWL9_XENCH
MDSNKWLNFITLFTYVIFLTSLYTTTNTLLIVLYQNHNNVEHHPGTPFLLLYDQYIRISNLHRTGILNIAYSTYYIITIISALLYNIIKSNIFHYR